MRTATRVLHVVTGYWPAIGGIETLVGDLAFVQQNTFGMHAAVLAPLRANERPEVSQVGGVTVYSPTWDNVYAVVKDATRSPLQKARALARTFA